MRKELKRRSRHRRWAEVIRWARGILQAEDTTSRERLEAIKELKGSTNGARRFFMELLDFNTLYVSAV